MLTASRRHATNQTEYFKNDPDDFGNPNWVSISPTTSGNFSMSFMTIKTSFISDGVNNNSQLFDDFIEHLDSSPQKAYYLGQLVFILKSADRIEILDGQQRPYKAGRKNIKVYSAIPHKPFTSVMNAEVGDGIELTKVYGAGNGGFELQLTEETENEIMSSASHMSDEPTYQANLGPVDLKVIDPRYLTQSDFALKMYGEVYNASVSDPRHIVLDETVSKWELVNITTSESFVADANISFGNQQLFSNFGFSVEIEQKNPADWDYQSNTASYEDNNGLISSSIEFANEYNPWLTGVRDVDEEDGETSLTNTYLWGRNWIHSGSFSSAGTNVFNDIEGDPDGIFEDVVNGTWAPYRLVSYYKDGPGYDNTSVFTDNHPISQTGNRLRSLQSVKIVYTSDKSKWSRCVVLESQDDPLYSEGGVAKLDLRSAESVDKDGTPDGTGTGMGWFPGYAINKETGERLNIMFAEDSWLSSDNGNDMKWNPSSRLQTQVPTWANGSYFLGGKHFVYVHSTKYDACEAAKTALTTNVNTKRQFFQGMMWVSVPLLNEGYELLSSDVFVNIDVSRESIEVRLLLLWDKCGYISHFTPPHILKNTYTSNEKKYILDRHVIDSK